MDIGKRIKERRKDLKISADELGRRLGKDRSTIYRYEKGDIENLPLDILEPIAKALSTTPQFLMGWEDTLPHNAIPIGPVGKLPILGNVSAGNGTLAYDNIIGYETVDEKYANENYFYLKVVGDSMSPKIEDGDLVLVHKQPSVNSGNYAVVIVDDEDGRVKIVKYGVDWIELHSINPYYPTRSFKGKDAERIRVIGKVIEIKRKL